MAMYGFNDLKDKIKRYFRFTQDEIKALIITIIVLSFIVGFNDKSEAFNFSHWSTNLFLVFVIIVIAVMVHISAQKIIGLSLGYNIEYNIWWAGLIVGLVLSIVTSALFKGNFSLWLLIPGGIVIHHLASHRLGYFRYGINTVSMSIISIAGPLANIIIATLLWTLQLWFHLFPESYALQQFILINWIFAVCTLLPIPPLNGSKVFFQSRLVFVFAFAFILGYMFLLIFKIHSFIGAFLIALILWLIYWVKFEQNINPL